MAPCPFVAVSVLRIIILVQSDLLLLQLKRPIRLRHRLQDLRVRLEEFVVNFPEAGNVLLAAATNAAIVANMESDNVAGESVAMEIHCCRDL